jgi:acyl carrier protein
MDRNELEESILSIIREQKNLPESFDRTTPLSEAGIDSLDALNILFALEESFGITIPDDQATAIGSLDDMVQTVEQLLGEKPAAGSAGS